MSSRNPFGDTSDDFEQDRNASRRVGGSGGSSSSDTSDRDDDRDASRRVGDDRNQTGSSSRRDDDDRDASRRVGDDRNQTGGRDRTDTRTETVSTDLPRTPDDVGDADFRNDTIARGVAETIGERGGQVGRGIADTALDVRGAGEGPDREVVEAVGESIGRVPGDVAELGVDLAQASTSITGAGAREGPVAAGRQARDLAADAADAGLSTTDQLLDIDPERRESGEGAAVEVEDANRQEAAVTATVGALSLAGGSVAGTTTGLGLRGLSDRVGGRTRASGSSTGVEADPVPTGRADVGTGGSGPVLDPDDVGQTDLRGDAVEVVDDTTDTVETGGGSDGLPLADDITDAGGVRRLLDEQRAGVRDFLDDDRAQAQLGRQRSRETSRGAPDADGGTLDDVRQDALTQLQDDLAGRAGRPDPGGFDPDGDPLGGAGGGRRGTIDPDTGDVDLGRSRGPTRAADADVDTADLDDGAGGFGDAFGAAVGAGASSLGEVDPTNDPTAIAPGVSTPAGATQPGIIADAEAGTGTLGDVDAVTDPTAIAPDTDTQTNTDTGTGTLLGGASATDTAGLELERELVRVETQLDGRQRLDARTEARSDTESRVETRTESRVETRAEARSEVRTEAEGRLRVDGDVRTRSRVSDVDLPNFDLEGDGEERGVGFQAVSEDFENPAVGIDVADDELTDDLADIDDPFEFSS